MGATKQKARRFIHCSWCRLAAGPAANEGQVSAVMASNLLGAICGGLLEYDSMYFGFRSLYVLAMACYLLAFASELLYVGSPKKRLVNPSMSVPFSVASGSRECSAMVRVICSNHQSLVLRQLYE